MSNNLGFVHAFKGVREARRERETDRHGLAVANFVDPARQGHLLQGVRQCVPVVQERATPAFVFVGRHYRGLQAHRHDDEIVRRNGGEFGGETTFEKPALRHLTETTEPFSLRQGRQGREVANTAGSVSAPGEAEMNKVAIPI